MIESLTEKDKALIKAFQNGLPITSTPYRDIAIAAGWDEDEAIRRLNELRESGVIRRVCAFVRQREVGYDANGMVVWDIPDEEVDSTVPFLAESSLVSHCYARPRMPGFQFNIYTMMHAKSRDEVHTEVERLAKKFGITSYRILYTVRELKRSTPQFFMERENDT